MDARLQAAALGALDRFASTAALDPAVLASFDAQKHLAEVSRSLRRRIEALEGYPNPAFNGLAEATARAILLFDRDGDAYARLVAPLERTGLEGHLDSLPGLALLNRIANELADDHAFGIDSTGAIAITDERPLTPRAFLAHVAGLDPDPVGHLVASTERMNMPTEQFSKHPFEFTQHGMLVNGRLRDFDVVVSAELDDAQLREASEVTNKRFAGVVEMSEANFGALNEHRYEALIDSFIEHVIKSAATIEQPTRSAPSMTTDQKSFVQVLQAETNTTRAHAVTLTETLGDLAAKHKRLCHIDLDEGLTAVQHRARDAIEVEIKRSVEGLSGVAGATFNYDPRGLTVGLKFDSGTYNTFTDGGSYTVPVNPAHLKSLASEPFWEAYVEAADAEAADAEFETRLAEVGVADPAGVAGRLTELATVYTKLAEIASMVGLTEAQEEAKQSVRSQVQELVGEIDGIKRVEFSFDSRYSTVKVELASGRANTLSGTWSVPIDDELFASYDDGREFWSPYIEAPTPSEGWLLLEITETGNAAFVDCGRDEEVSRIISAAADKVAGWGAMHDAELPLLDINGNTVGTLTFATGPVNAFRDLPEGSVRLLIHETGHAAFEEPHGSIEVERILRSAAERVRSGQHLFNLHDINGNLVGAFGWTQPEPPSPEKASFLQDAFEEGRLFVADGIEDGEYFLVVTDPEFTPGYHQGQGQGWLVNTSGEAAPGYEDGDTIREVHLRDLTRTEREVIRDMLDGKLTAQEVTKRFVPDEDEDLEPH